MNKTNTSGVTNLLRYQIIVVEMRHTTSRKITYSWVVKDMLPMLTQLRTRVLLIVLANFSYMFPYETFNDTSIFIQSYLLIHLKRPELKKIRASYEDKFYLGIDISSSFGCMSLPSITGRNKNTHQFVTTYFTIKTGTYHRIYLAYDVIEDKPDLSLAFSIS
jgi:hypothetical protein